MYFSISISSIIFMQPLRPYSKQGLSSLPTVGSVTTTTATASASLGWCSAGMLTTRWGKVVPAH